MPLKIEIVYKRNVDRKLDFFNYIRCTLFHYGQVVGFGFLKFHALEGESCAEHTLRAIIAGLIRDDRLGVADGLAGGIHHENIISSRRSFATDRLGLVEIQRENS